MEFCSIQSGFFHFCRKVGKDNNGSMSFETGVTHCVEIFEGSLASPAANKLEDALAWDQMLHLGLPLMILDWAHVMEMPADPNSRQ